MPLKLNIYQKVLTTSVCSIFAVSVLSFSYYNMQSTIVADTVSPTLFNIFPLNIAEASNSAVPDPLIGAAFKQAIPTSNTTPFMPTNMPVPPNIQDLPSIPTLPGVIQPQQGAYVSGIILPNVAIINTNGTAHVVKTGMNSPLGLVESVSYKGVTISGKYYPYERN